MLTLTGKEIKDLAEAVGLVIAPHDYTDELETEMTIIDCPASGVLDDDGKGTHYKYVAFLSEYPEEGVFPLGHEVTPNVQNTQPRPDVEVARLRGALEQIARDCTARKAVMIARKALSWSR